MSTVNTWPVKSIILYNNIEGVFYDQKDRQETLGIFYEAIFPLEEAHIVSPINIPLPPPPQTRTLDFEMLYG